MRNPLARLLALLLTLGLTAGACSSGSGDSDAAAISETGTEQETGTEAEASSTDDVDNTEQPGDQAAAVACEEAGEAGSVLRGANGTMIQLSPETEADISLDFASVRSAVETLRPAQDLVGPLGTMREGLDNIEADLTVLEEKRYDDVVGGYGLAKISGVIVEVLC